jgi:putative proteasome-type protease
MTYCVAMRLDQGLVFLADSRTNAGVDQINTFRKLTVFERPGDRMIVLMSAGNLAISQAVRQALAEPDDPEAPNIWTAASMIEVARLVGDGRCARVHERDAEALARFAIDFNASFIVGGQVGAERTRLFQLYAPGNFIEAQDECCYFQIGEAKYGKPIIDRVVTPSTPLDEAAKCALISMDSTLRSNVSVGLPLDLLVYEAASLHVTRFVQIDHSNQYFNMIRNTWGQRLRQVFGEIPDPRWEAGSIETEHGWLGSQALGRTTGQARSQPVRMAPPPALADGARPAEPAPVMVQTLAQGAAAVQPQR